MENLNNKNARSPIESLVTEKALAIVNGRGNEDILEEFMNHSDSPQIKNVCAKLSVGLSDEIDSLCDLLDISKRSFIEVALIDAIKKTRDIIELEGVYDSISVTSKDSK